MSRPNARIEAPSTEAPGEQIEPEPPELKTIRHSRDVVFVSGFVAGVASRSLTAPLDRCKIILQAQRRRHQTMSLRHLIVNIYKDGGILSFWRGNGTNCIKMGPEQGMRFFVYDLLQRRIGEDSDLSFSQRWLCGAISGATAQTCIYPLEVAKTRLALGSYNGIIHCLRQVYAEAGVRGLFAGYGASVSGVIPYVATDLSIFYTLKSKYRKRYRKEPQTIHFGIFGAISAVIAQLVSYPFAVARVRLQAQGMSEYQTKFNGLFDCFITTFRQTGIRGIYRGLSTNLLRVVPAISLTYIINETLKRELSQRFK